MTKAIQCFTLPGALGRFIRRRPSQQQLRARTEDTETSKSKLPRSRSERVLSTKKRGQRDCDEDGFSVQELAASFSKFKREDNRVVDSLSKRPSLSEQTKQGNEIILTHGKIGSGKTRLT